MHKNKFHVFGGHDGGSSSSKTTELICIDGGVDYGPELQAEAVYLHAITSINSTVVSSDEDWHQSPLTPQCHSCLEPE
jgi:hypothetical protein